MPLYKDATTKVFDTFLDVGDAPLLIRWPAVDLDPPDLELLERLVRRLGYLGRAESWVEGSVRTEPSHGTADVTPATAAAATEEEPAEIVRVLAPMPPSDYAAWRATELGRREASALAGKKESARSRNRAPEREKLTAKEIDRIAAALPHSLFEALQAETSALRKAGWSDPPGSRWLDYRRPAGKTDRRPAPRRARPATKPGRTVARFALASAVLPQLTEAVKFSEKLRQALLSRSDGAPVFAGRDAGGVFLRDHRHTFILPEANGRHGRITHVTLHAEMGFEDEALRALHRLASISVHNGHDIQTVLIGVGTPEAFAGTDLEAGQCPLLVESKLWVSRTPFVPTRHPKTTRSGEPKLDPRGLQIGSPEHDLGRLLRELGRGLPEPVRVERISGTRLGGKAGRWSAFRTRRTQGGGRRAPGAGYGFRIEFPEPVRGPIAVGYGAHFGLGMFAPPIAPFELVDDRP
jgi:CRISPR-associated protein Csb2